MGNEIKKPETAETDTLKKLADAKALIAKTLGLDKLDALNSADADGWLASTHLDVGAVIGFEILGARVYKTDGGKKKYGLGYIVKLLNPVGDGTEECPRYAAGQVVILGERYKLRVLRNLHIGAMCVIQVKGRKDIGNAQELIDIEVTGADAKVPGDALVNQISLSWEAAKAGNAPDADPWDMA